mmetsp:Transcript_17811/g.54450  ORF Transcript_17811/g.54450 Transcript_17811/m.54450 type:complete len:227 (-) Transcript_17811:281-961(-)
MVRASSQRPHFFRAAINRVNVWMFGGIRRVCMSSKTRSACCHRACSSHAASMALYVASVGFKPRRGHSSKSRTHVSHCERHACNKALYVLMLGSRRRALSSSKSCSARCHWPQRSAAAIIAEYEMILGWCVLLTSSKSSTALSHWPQRPHAAMTPRYVIKFGSWPRSRSSWNSSNAVSQRWSCSHAKMAALYEITSGRISGPDCRSSCNSASARSASFSDAAMAAL